MLGMDAQPFGMADRAGSQSSASPRLRRASWAFTTRRVPRDVACALGPLRGAPRAGDLILARVDALGHHAGLQLASGRRKQLFVDDEIVVAYGNRYAASQFEALVPETLGPCHLAAGGGVAARAVSWHDRIAKGPTHITPQAMVVDAHGQRVNLQHFALYPIEHLRAPRPTVVAVVGTGMDSGKTQTAAYFVKGLTAAGLHVGYAKVTGTGAGGDTWLLKDAGAFPVLDFTDAGVATTYRVPHAHIARIFTTLIGHVARSQVDVVVVEVADGVFQCETAELLRSKPFAEYTDGVILTARDAMGASAGVAWLAGQPVPVLALGGILSAAPLQVREAHSALGLAVRNRQELATPDIALALLGGAIPAPFPAAIEP